MKRNNKIAWTIFLMVIVFLGISGGLLKITGFNIFGISFDFDDEDKNNNDGPIIVNSQIKDLEIREFYPEMEIFSINDSNATVHFIIDNWLRVPYNITVEFFYEDKYIGKWFNTSVETYNTTTVENRYYSYHPIFDNAGDWKVQLIIDYLYEKTPLKQSKTISFKVIEREPVPLKITYHGDGSITKEY